MEFISHSKEETWKFAENYAKSLKAGDVLALFGDLGAGKTTFAQGLAKAVGVEDNVTSPTFVIMKNYSAHFQGKDIKFNHIDCYRITETDAESIGLDEIFDDLDSITLLEWPENIKKILPSKVKTLNFEYIDEETRSIKYNQ